jgi:hypothetical protein
MLNHQDEVLDVFFAQLEALSWREQRTYYVSNVSFLLEIFHCRFETSGHDQSERTEA